MVHAGGAIELSHSTFEENFDAESDLIDGIGIANLGGMVQCDTSDCLRVCTLCRGDDEQVSWTRPPAQQPVTAASTKNQPASRFLLWAGLAGLISIISMVAVWQYRIRGVGPAFTVSEAERTTIEDGTLSDHLVDQATNTGAIELVLCSVMKSSPAPIIVVDRDMRIKLWSCGMSSVSPMLVSPLNGLFSALPFAGSCDGTQLSHRIHRMLANDTDAHQARQNRRRVRFVEVGPEIDEETVQSFTLILRSTNGPVSLEMVANVLVSGSGERLVVMSGRVSENPCVVTPSDASKEGSINESERALPG